MTNKVLILGAQGQLGQAFAEHFGLSGIDYLAPEERDCDITNSDMLHGIFEQYHPKVLINCAAYNAVDAAEKNSEKAYKINKEAVGLMTGLCNKFGCQLIHYGSDYVFDGKKLDYYNEDDPTAPLNIYGKSKLGGEMTALSSNPSFLVFRLSWVIGRGQQNFLYKLRNWAKINRILRISADEVSVPTFTDDIVKMTIKALESGLSGLYHMTSSGYASRYELARFYIDHLNMNNVIVPVPMSSFETKAARPQFSPMSNQRLAKDLNIEIPTWQECLLRFFSREGN